MIQPCLYIYHLPHGSVGKESTWKAGDLSLIPGSRRSPGEGNGNPLQYSCLENPMGRGTWRATLHGIARVGYDLVTKPPPYVYPQPFELPSHSGGEGNGNPFQCSCLENPRNRGAWWVAVHRVTKSQTWLSDFIFTFHFHALEKEMATHSSVLAWRIPGTGEPGGLPSMGLHRVRHDWNEWVSSSNSSSSPFRSSENMK